MIQIPDILQIERENRRRARERRERENQAHLDQPEMGDHEEEPPVIPPVNEERNEEQQNFEQQNQGGGGMFRQPQQNRRPIGAYDEPNIRAVSLGIVPPLIPANSFELKAGMLGMVERTTFKGNAVECPLEHLHRFERLSRTFKVSGIPEDTVKMMLFPFSLEDKAAYWEKTIPSNQVSTWGDVKTAFLRKFFPKQKTARFRNNIQSFVQRGDESLSEAWDRLKDYTRSCPHHGFTKENLLGIFYRGVLNEIRRALDTASYGSFASLDVEAAEQLIENLAQSDACFGGDYDRTVRGSSSGVDSKIEQLNERFDKLTKMLMGNQRHVAFVDGSQGGNQEAFLGYNNEGVVENQEEVNYVGNQGGYNNYKPFNSHPNLSYRSTNVENPQDQTYPTQAQGFQPQAFNNFQPRPQQGFGQSRPNFQQQSFQPKGNLQGNFQPRGSGFQAPSAQPSQDAEIKTMLQSLIEGQTRGQRENEKRFKEVETQIEQVVSRVKSLEGQVAQIASTSQPPMGIFPGKAVANPKAPCNAVLESGKAQSIDEAVSSKNIQESTAEKGVKEKKVGAEIAGSKEKPFEDPKEKFRRIVEIVEREQRLEEEARRAKEEAARPQPASTLRTLIDKGNPGKFNIPVSLGGKTFEDALCDSGSYVNVISWELVKELGIKGMEPHSTPIMFGDASKKIPKGVIKRCPIIVGDCIVPSDFLVIDMVDAENQPLLLGAPFLQIAGAVIDYAKGVVTLKHVDEAKGYPIRPQHEFCGTIKTNEAVNELQEVTTVETVLLPAVNMFSIETKVEVEAPSKEEAASLAIEPKVEAVSLFDSDCFALEKLFEVEAPSKEEAASPLTEARAEIKVLQGEQSAAAKQFEVEVPLQKEATSQTASITLKKKKAKKVKKKQPEQAQHEPHEPLPPSFTLKPSKIVAGKLECTIKSKSYSKPFAKARIILDSTTNPDSDLSVLTAKMANLFGIKPDDRGPYPDGSSHRT